MTRELCTRNGARCTRAAGVLNANERATPRRVRGVRNRRSRPCDKDSYNACDFFEIAICDY